jgi:XTP/dITP diphosphohydrolase
VNLCFASNNNHKLSEIRPLLEPDFSILSLAEIGCFEELAETQDTLEGNSRQKAEYVFDRYNVPCFADDTGLEVEALDHAPGVYSARYAGEHKNSNDNIDLLLKNLKEKSNRKARFRTVITLAGFEGGIHLFEGVVEGTIINSRKGTDGFGYDPVFQPAGFNKTFAEMSLEEKNGISHRARAILKLITFLKNYPGK